MSQRGRYLLVQVVTCARIPLALIAIPFMMAGGTASYVIAFTLYLLCEITDILDGTLARAMHLESPFGKLFDPYCDSTYRLCVYFTLAWPGVDIFPLWVVWVMAVRDVAVAYLRMGAIARGAVIQARLSGKLKAIVQGTGACVAVGMKFIPIFDAIAEEVLMTMAVTVAAVTLWSLVDYAVSVARTLRRPAS
jgi:CDP-diacylglycerol--glycerol-3-phosphate 3-phosphatidyltransferase